MTYRRTILVTLLACSSFIMFISGMTGLAYAEQKTTTKNQHAAPKILSGKVTEIINMAGYTYTEVNIGKKKVWAAGPVTPLKVGDKVSFSTRLPMNNFHSKSMKRDFSVLYFVDRFFTGDKKSNAGVTGKASSHARYKKKTTSKLIKGIKKVEGGFSISEIYADKEKLKGKKLRVRGKLTKFTANIMGKNWLHIRDSSTLQDLTITTKDTAVIDDVIIVEGKLELNKDFSYGYVYPVILLDAKITKQ